MSIGSLSSPSVFTNTLFNADASSSISYAFVWRDRRIVEKYFLPPFKGRIVQLTLKAAEQISSLLFSDTDIDAFVQRTIPQAGR